MWLWLLRLAIWGFALLSIRGTRWAYVAFMLLAFVYFPARVGFQIHPRSCEMAIDLPMIALSLKNSPHIIMLAIFFVITSAQFRMNTGSAYLGAGLLTIAMGTLIEIGEGISGNGHCRLRDLVPDSAGALIGAAVVYGARL